MKNFTFYFIQTRRRQQRFSNTISFSSFDTLKIDDDNDNDFMNIVMIDVAFFFKFVDKKNQIKNIRLFFITLIQIQFFLKKIKDFFSKNSNAIDFNAIVKQIKKKLFEKISNFFHKFAKIIDFIKIEKMSFRKFYDHKIEFTNDFSKLFKNRVYFLSLYKFEIIKKYLKKNLKKKFINFNQTSFVFFVLFAIKLNEKFRFYIDYRKLNVITKKNVYSIFLINEILTRIIDCKHIFKFNIIVAFNKLRIIENDKIFTIFIISMNIYKYHMLFFDFINDLIN